MYGYSTTARAASTAAHNQCKLQIVQIRVVLKITSMRNRIFSHIFEFFYRYFYGLGIQPPKPNCMPSYQLMSLQLLTDIIALWLTKLTNDRTTNYLIRLLLITSVFSWLSLPPSRVPGYLHYLLAASYILYSIDYRDISHWIMLHNCGNMRYRIICLLKSH